MLDKTYNFLEKEKQIQDLWETNKIYNFDERSNKKIYSIDTPPPTVNGAIHIGHIYSYTHIDMIARFKRMTGHNVFYAFGFDDNGLPTERFVEKTIGKKSFEIPRAEFNEECLKQTEKLELTFKNLFKSMGHSPDWRFVYSTINQNSQKAAQKSFLDLYKKNKAYRADEPALWCTECKTSIAQAELETKEIESTFNYLKFYITDKIDTKNIINSINEKSEYLEIATTRPEMLCACDCIFVNPSDKKHAKFIGKRVIVPLYNFTVPILADDKVDLEKGTGVVMCCTFGDQTDLEWFKKYNLELKIAIDEQGCMTNLAGKYAGMYLLKARKLIIEDLKEAGILYKQDAITHSVAVHERCGTPMEILKKQQWFINITDEKEKFIKAGNDINWYPTHMKARYLNWVENVSWDWNITRQKYFGVPFPVWYCKSCGKILTADEKDLPIDPNITKPTHTCDCGCKEFLPETAVMDTWMTSSLSPLINAKWYDDDKFNNNLLPMSLRPNAHDIIRTWDFYTIVKSIYHTNKLPWENVMISGFIMAAKGEKISKSKGNNKADPISLIQNYSADVVRYWATCASLGNDIIFAEDEFLKGKKLTNKLYNASKFVLEFLKDFDPNTKVILEPMDKWIINTFNEMFALFMSNMEKYEISLSMKCLEKFFWLFCDNYIEIVKNRLYKPEIYGEHAKQSGQKTCYYCLLNMLKCFAIFIPHITEVIYQDAFKNTQEEQFIHQTKLEPINFEEAKNLVTKNENFISAGEEFTELLSLARRYKTEKNVSMKTLLNDVTVYTRYPQFMEEAKQDFKAVNSIVNLTIEKSDRTKIIIDGVEV